MWPAAQTTKHTSAGRPSQYLITRSNPPSPPGWRSCLPSREGENLLGRHVYGGPPPQVGDEPLAPSGGSRVRLFHEIDPLALLDKCDLRQWQEAIFIANFLGDGHLAFTGHAHKASLVY